MSEEGLKRLEALKITPGPWVCEMVSNDDASWVVGTAVDANDNPVAGIVEREQAETITPDVAVCESLTPDRENGLLIAAAPALLSYLRAAHDEIERLKRVADQAIDIGTISLLTQFEGTPISNGRDWFDPKSLPDLAAYLRESGEPVEGGA